jgi:outer membrane protein assembly factor BamB
MPRSAGLTLVAIGIAGMAAGLALPWARSGGLYPDGATIAGIVLLGPLLSLIRLGYGHLDQHAPSVAAAIAAAAAAAVAGASARQVDPSAGIGFGGPLTVLAALTATLGWVLMMTRFTLPRPRLILAGIVALVVALDGVGLYWAIEGRFVDTATAAAASTPKDPPKLTGERWHRSVRGVSVIGIAGPQILVLDEGGVRGFAAQTGKPTWHYLRSDVRATTAGVVGDVVVTAFSTGEGVMVTAHETSTGSERFSRRSSLKNWRPTTVVSTVDGRLAVLAGSGPDAGELVALDARTGDVRWTWQPTRDGGPCDVNGIAAASGTIGLAVRCRARGVTDLVIGLSTDDGREQWTWNAPYSTDVPRGPELAMRPVEGGFLVQYGAEPRRASFIAGDSGSLGTGIGSERAGMGTLATVSGTTMVYYATDGEGAELTALDARNGTSSWRVRLSTLIGWRLVSAYGLSGRAYLLLSTRQPESAGGPLRLLAIEGGQVIGDASLSCDTACGQATITANEHSAVVASRERAAGLLTLVALA